MHVLQATAKKAKDEAQSSNPSIWKPLIPTTVEEESNDAATNDDEEEEEEMEKTCDDDNCLSNVNSDGPAFDVSQLPGTNSHHVLNTGRPNRCF